MNRTSLLFSAFAGAFCCCVLLFGGNPVTMELDQNADVEFKMISQYLGNGSLSSPVVLFEESRRYDPASSYIPGTNESLPKQNLNECKELLKRIGADALTDYVDAHAGKKGAEAINAAVTEYLWGSGTAKAAAEKGLDAAIDQYVRDADSNAALKNAYRKLDAGKSVDFKEIGTVLAKSEADKLIDDSNLSANQKKLAHAAIADLAGEKGAMLNASTEYIEAKLIKEGISGDQAKKIAGQVHSYLNDTDNTADLKSAASELAQELVQKHVGSKGAATINAAIQEYMSAEGTAKGAAEKALDKALDEYVRDPASHTALKKAVEDIKNDKTPDYQAVGTALAKHGADKLIDDSGLSANEKKLAHAAIADIAGEDGALVNATAEHIRAKLVKVGISEDQAQSISGNIREYLADTGNTANLKSAASELTQELVEKHVGSKGAATINAAIQEYMSAEGTAKGAAEKALDTALDQYVRDPESHAALKQAVEDIRNDKTPNYQAVGTALAKHGADKLIDDSDLSANEKKLAHAAIADMAGEKGAMLSASYEYIQTKLIKEGIPEEQANSIAGKVRSFLNDTDNTADLRDAASELAQELVQKHVGSKGAATINAAIQEYMSAEGTAKSAAEKALDAALDEYVRDPASHAALKQAVEDIRNDKTPDYQAVGTALAKHGADKLIDDSGLSANEKKLAHAAIADMAGEDGALVNATAEHIRAKLVKAGVSEEQAQKISGNIQQYLADTGNLPALKAAASDSLQELVTKCVDEKGAATINAAIREYMGAEGTAKGAVEAALNTAIDQYVRDPASNAALKESLANLKEGKSIDYPKVGTALARHGADKLVDGSGLSSNQKELVHGVIAEIVGEEGSMLNASRDYIQKKLIKAGFSEEQSGQIAENLYQFMNDTRNTSALTHAASDTAQVLVSQYVGGKGADVINAAIQEYMSAEGSAKSAAEVALNTAIDRYVRDEKSNEALKGVVADLKAGKAIDYKGTATALAQDGANKLIDGSDLSSNQKVLARGVIAEIAGEEGAFSNATGEYIRNKLIKKGIPEEEADKIAANIQNYLADTGNTGALKAAATDAAQALVSKYVGEEGAAVINSAIEKYMSEGGTAGGAAEAALEAAIDQYVKGDEAKNALKEALRKSKNGEAVDYGDVGSKVFTSYALDAIENSNMSEEEKEAARSAVLSLKGEVPWSETGAEVLEAVLIKAGVSREHAEQAAKSIIAFATGDGDLKSLANNALTIFSSKIADAINKQLEKWEKKFPFLKEIYGAFGISREDIVNFFKDLSVDKIKDAFKIICNLSMEDWKNIGKQLLNKLLDKALQKLGKCLKKLADKLIDKLKKQITAVLEKIHFLKKYMDYVKFGLEIVANVGKGQAGSMIKTTVEQGGTTIRSIWDSGNNDKKNGN